MKNVQRHIHDSIELTECDKHGAGETEDIEAVAQQSPQPVSEDMTAPGDHGRFISTFCLDCSNC